MSGHTESSAAEAVAAGDNVTIRVKLPCSEIDFKIRMDPNSHVRHLVHVAKVTYTELSKSDSSMYPKVDLDATYEWHKAKYVYMSKIIKDAPTNEVIKGLEPDELTLVGGINICLLDGGKRLRYYITNDKRPRLLDGTILTLYADEDASQGVYIHAPPSGEPAAKKGKMASDEAEAPLTDQRLHLVQWHEPEPPNFLHKLAPVGLCLSASGDSVPYVQPPSFDEAYTHLTAAIRTKDLGREYVKVLIDGPSGSGKTRMVWELYRRLQKETEVRSPHLHIEAVSYVSINLTDSFLPEVVMASDAAVENKLAERIISQLSASKLYANSSISLGGVLTSLFCGRKSALVLHIDEFHRHPAETVRLLSVTRAYSVRKGTSSVILTACSGLYTDPSFDSNTISKRIPLGFFRDHQKTWDIVHGAALAVSRFGYAHPLLAEGDLSKAPSNMQYLVEDLAGWPMAAVQLGVNILPRRELRHDATAHELAGVEDMVVKALEDVYPFETLCRAFGGTSLEALVKLATLALSPFPVAKSEPINGITVADIRRCGIVDDQPSRAGTMAQGQGKEVMSTERVFLRMSKPMLRIIVKKLSVLEMILTGGNTTLPKGALPDDLELSDLLRTCRRYDADTLEAVQLISHLVAVHAWLVMEHRPDAEAPSLLTLRPGAKVLGSVGLAGQKLDYLAEAAAAVDAAGVGRTGSDRTKYRQEAALKMSIRLVERTRTPPLGSAALSKACGAGFDMVVRLGTVTQHGQTKGRERGGDADVIPSHLRTLLEGFEAAVRPAGKEAAKGKRTAVAEESVEIMHLEVLFAGKASTSTEQILAGCRTGEESAATLQTHREILRVLGENISVIVMMRAELDRALGSVFGGIAARCHKERVEEATVAAGGLG